MDIILNIYRVIDIIFMPFFRFPDNPLLGYFMGTFLLSLACVIIGKYSISIAFRFNKEKINHDIHETEHYQKLSFEALKTGNKAAYKACNSIANDAYGKNFFSQIALSASSLWPAFIALGWMQYRFSLVEISLPFPVNGYSFGYGAVFFVCYVSARLMSAKIRNTYYLYKDQSG